MDDTDNDNEMAEEEEDQEKPPSEQPEDTTEHTYLPGDELADDEELTFDKSAYHMYHAAQTGAPCLSFDVIPDTLGSDRDAYPMTCYLACGTQAQAANQNSLIVMRMSNLTRIQQGEDDDDNDYIEDAENGPHLNTASIKHVGGVNRVRHCNVGDKKLTATWSDTGKVHVWDTTTAMASLDLPNTPDHQKIETRPLFTFAGHQTEGFALDWSPTVPGRLATGSCNRNIHLWAMREAGSWVVDQRPLNAHTDSVEDIQWSPNEREVFASCSVDRSVRVWDARGAGERACMITVPQAHQSDVNVISWNRHEPFIVSGGDDGVIKVWDLRQLSSAGSAVATFKQHTRPITSVEWHPTDATVFAAAGDDHQITLWDLAVERDDADMNDDGGEADDTGRQLPPQLLFIHAGQTDIKELHWHPQLPGVLASTAASGFNVFKTISV